MYAKNTSESLFAYYTDLGHWMSQPLYNLSDVGDGDFLKRKSSCFVRQLASCLICECVVPGRPAAGRFFGGIDSSALGCCWGDVSFMTPNRAEGVMMSWSGQCMTIKEIFRNRSTVLGHTAPACSSWPMRNHRSQWMIVWHCRSRRPKWLMAQTP